MKDIMTLLKSLKRPRLLIQAARIGGEHYQRDLHLHRVLGENDRRGTGQTLMQLIDLEAGLDEKRRVQDPAYNIASHVEVLSVMMGEAKILRAQTPRATEPTLSVVGAA